MDSQRRQIVKQITFFEEKKTTLQQFYYIKNMMEFETISFFGTSRSVMFITI